MRCQQYGTFSGTEICHKSKRTYAGQIPNDATVTIVGALSRVNRM
jgi:hypothetical protein